MKSWSESTPGRARSEPPLPLRVEAVIARAAGLTALQIQRLDALDRPELLIFWDLLRDALSDPADEAMRLFAGERAWRAAVSSLGRAGIDEPDHDYWRVSSAPGLGACRASRYAACASISLDIDPDIARPLVANWTAVNGA